VEWIGSESTFSGLLRKTCSASSQETEGFSTLFVWFPASQWNPVIIDGFHRMPVAVYYINIQSSTVHPTERLQMSPHTALRSSGAGTRPNYAGGLIRLFTSSSITPYFDS